MTRSVPRHAGAALIVALWTVPNLSLLIGGLAYEMHVEAGITSHARKRMKAQVAARGGVEYAKFLLAKSFESNAFEEGEEEKEDLRGQAFNLSNEIHLTTLEIVEMILRLMNSDHKPDILNEASNEIRHQYLSAVKARKILGWQPLFSLEEGLRRTIEWYEEFLRYS